MVMHRRMQVYVMYRVVLEYGYRDTMGGDMMGGSKDMMREVEGVLGRLIHIIHGIQE